jgi:hypothetical protein
LTPQPHDIVKADSADSVGGVGAPDQIEVTPAMIDAGAGAFYRVMLEKDYLACAPNESHIREMVMAIYSCMKSANPLLSMKRM